MGIDVTFKRLLLAALSAALVLAAPAPAQAGASSTPSSAFPGFDNTVWAVAHRGNTVYVGGEFAHVTDSHGTTFARAGAAAFDATTGDVLPWNPRANGPVYALATSSKAVYLGGSFSTVRGKAHRNVARVSLSGVGTPTASFKHATDRQVRALAVGHGRLYLGGGFGKLDGRPRSHAAAVSTSAPYAVTSWAPKLRSGGVDEIVSTGKGVFVAGGFGRFGAWKKYRHLVLVTSASGKLARSFKPSLRYQVQDIAVGDKRVYVAMAGPGGHVFALNRRSGGTVWSHWTDGDAQAVQLVRGTVYLGGHYNRVCDDPRSGVSETCRSGTWHSRKRAASFTTDGRLASWNPAGNSNWGVRAFDYLSAQDELVVGGHVTKWDNGTVTALRLAVFGPDS